MSPTPFLALGSGTGVKQDRTGSGQFAEVNTCQDLPPRRRRGRQDRGEARQHASSGPSVGILAAARHLPAAMCSAGPARGPGSPCGDPPDGLGAALPGSVRRTLFECPRDTDAPGVPRSPCRLIGSPGPGTAQPGSCGTGSSLGLGTGDDRTSLPEAPPSAGGLTQQKGQIMPKGNLRRSGPAPESLPRATRRSSSEINNGVGEPTRWPGITRRWSTWLSRRGVGGAGSPVRRGHSHRAHGGFLLFWQLTGPRSWEFVGEAQSAENAIYIEADGWSYNIPRRDVAGR